MEETNETVTTTTTTVVTEKKRPAFLTVLCILTFIGSAWGIISALVMTDPGLKSYASYYYWVVLLLNLGTLFGAFMMWQLKKGGLYLYTISNLAGIVLMWVVVKGYISSLIAPSVTNVETGNARFDAMASSMSSSMVEGAMNTALILGTVFPVLFLILYWVNAKHLK